ncbi:hypothetical protein [Pontibaca methylaminivorans]|uniref:hypothetical protein n=1 Tax=Pontibaca methylaminivorans TaxID=515897 RepID=UPI0013563123|nr:hypothetical protein [Pontibaca methylaminivorans]
MSPRAAGAAHTGTGGAGNVAKEDWRQGRFETVPDDEAEFPLPANGTKPRRALGGVFYP